MSDSLKPWILEFLLDIAQKLGAKLFDVQPYQKKKKVQIIEFLTYPSKEQKDTFIWARISDKKHIATVKFTKEAVSNHARVTGMRLTQHKGAIVGISKFKPICSRFPLEQDRMSNVPFIIFECDSVEILGASGEATFGLPKGIEQVPEISQWSKGLGQGGGAGNVLKDRVQEMEERNTKLLPPMPTPPTPIPQLSKADANAVIHPYFKRDDQDIETYKARWHFVEKNRLRFIGPPIENVIEQRQESVIEETDLGRRFRSGTPVSDWEHSPAAKGRSDSIIIQAEDSSELARTTSCPPATTPAQRATPGPSSLDVVNETPISPRTSHLLMERKVPRPASPKPPAAAEIGPGRVLVPNSESSQSQSQPKSTMNGAQVLLGGNVVDTTEKLPWISIGEVNRIIETTAELRLHNHGSMKC